MIYIFHHKSKVFQKFQTYKSLVKNHIGWKVQTLRSDNGGEYASNDFKRFCETHRILQQYTTPYTLEQNGVFECKS
jgi:transposase InsO family protein